MKKCFLVENAFLRIWSKVHFCGYDGRVRFAVLVEKCFLRFWWEMFFFYSFGGKILFSTENVFLRFYGKCVFAFLRKMRVWLENNISVVWALIMSFEEAQRSHLTIASIGHCRTSSQM